MNITLRPKGTIFNGHENSTNLLERVFIMNLFNSLIRLESH